MRKLVALMVVLGVVMVGLGLAIGLSQQAEAGSAPLRCGGYTVHLNPDGSVRSVKPPRGGAVIAVADVIIGTDAGETLNGDAADNLIIGLGGDDTLNGMDGDDVLCGDGGEDTLNGGGDNDTLLGGGQDDVLNGGDGDDTLVGAGGDDTCNGDGGAGDTAAPNCEDINTVP